MGCLCHLTAIATRNAAKKLPVCVEEVLLDIMYHFKGSSKRNRQFAEIQDACGSDELALLNYCPTRCLALGQCIPRILQKKFALLTFLGKYVPDDPKVQPQKCTADEHSSSEPSKKTRVDPSRNKSQSDTKTKPDATKKHGSTRSKHYSKTSQQDKRRDGEKSSKSDSHHKSFESGEKSHKSVSGEKSDKDTNHRSGGNEKAHSKSRSSHDHSKSKKEEKQVKLIMIPGHGD